MRNEFDYGKAIAVLNVLSQQWQPILMNLIGDGNAPQLNGRDVLARRSSRK